MDFNEIATVWGFVAIIDIDLINNQRENTELTVYYTEINYKQSN